MDIVGILLTLLALALVGFIVYLITENIPMPALYKQAFNVAAVVLLVIYLIMVIAGRAPLVTLPIWGHR